MSVVRRINHVSVNAKDLAASVVRLKRLQDMRPQTVENRPARLFTGDA
jgi:hypothetical protein